MAQSFIDNGGRHMNRILRMREVSGLTGLSRSTIYRSVWQGSFPPPLKLGTRAVGWRESDVERWIEGRADVSRLSP
jgi:prophage regulatory protein